MLREEELGKRNLSLSLKLPINTALKHGIFTCGTVIQSENQQRITSRETRHLTIKGTFSSC